MRLRPSAWAFLGLCAAGALAPSGPPAPPGAGMPATPAPPESQAAVPDPSPTPAPAPVEGLKVVILNGCGAPKVALRLSVALDRRRIRTLRTDNADRKNYEATILRPRAGRDSEALSLAGILGLGAEALESGARLPPEADILIILGGDHAAVLDAASRRDEP